MYSEATGDVTYFLVYHLDAIRRALDGLVSYIARKRAELRESDKLVRAFPGLNYRQRLLLRDAIEHPERE